MSDFITLQCPDCGGKLIVVNNTLSLKCEQCSTEYMIRREANRVFLESYACCPVCNRNDRAEKVSAILRSQTQNTQGYTYQNQVSTERIGNSVRTTNQQVPVPIQSSQMSDLVKNLYPPPKPVMNALSATHQPSSTALYLALITSGLGACCLLASLTLFLNSSSVPQSNSTGAENFLVGGLVFVGIAVLLFIYVVPGEKRSNIIKKAAAVDEQRASQVLFDEEMRKWNLAIQKWNQLYYCSRDECVFLPGSNTNAPIANMMGYIYWEPK